MLYELGTNVDFNFKLKTTKDLIVSWHFFEIISHSFNINNELNNYKITISNKFKRKLIHFIQYDKNIVKNYKRNKNIPLSKEYFKILGDTLLRDENIKYYKFKTVPILLFKNLVVIGIIFINNKMNTNLHNQINYKILYKKIFLTHIDNCFTRFNNINIFKGIINSPINEEYLKDNIILVNDCKTILNDNLVIHCSLLNLLNIIQKYSYILEFKI